MAVNRFYFFGSYIVRPLIMEVESDENGVVIIPTTGAGYNYDVKTSDGQTFTGVTGNLTITFPSANTRYDVEITGLFPRFHFNFNNGSERSKIKDIKQWGSIKWGMIQQDAFSGCGDMDCSALDSPDMGNTTNGSNMFRDASLFTGANFSPTLENLTNGSNMFYNASSFIGTNFAPTLANLTNGSYMFYNAINFAQDINAPNSVNLERDSGMFFDTKIQKITLNNTALTTTIAATFRCSELTDLILTGREIDLWINQAPLLLSTKIDALADSVADLTSLTSATITMTQAQYDSCAVAIWTNKNWTIAIV